MSLANKINYPSVLTIAGSDSSGGAGIQADIKTISALNCYAASVITALTAQNTESVKSIFPVSHQFVGEQLDAVLNDMNFSATKIGMLFDPAIIECVAEKLINYKIKNIVLDPVMVSKSGSKLITDEAIFSLKKYLIPLVNVLTPNLDEAQVLLGRRIYTRADMQCAALDLGKEFNVNVIIKGGHAQNDICADILYYQNQFHWVEVPRVSTKNTHGTGCTFSAAIAAFLASGCNLITAMHKAKNYLTGAIEAGKEFMLGKGHGPVHHFYRIQNDIHTNATRNIAITEIN